MPLSIYLENEDATVALGKRIGNAASGGCIITLDGQLGAGKTTLCRGVLASFEYYGAVKSPTYTLVEPYEFSQTSVFHFDLYRLGDPEELEFMGIRDYFQPHVICLVEWPSRGEGYLPVADLGIVLTVDGSGRKADINYGTRRGEQVLSLIQE